MGSPSDASTPPRCPTCDGWGEVYRLCADLTVRPPTVTSTYTPCPDCTPETP